VNAIDEELRELMHRKVTELGPADPPGPDLRRRSRRRQGRTVAVVGIVAVAALAGSVAGIRTALHLGRATQLPAAGSTGPKAITLYGITLTVPRDWTLLQLDGAQRPNRTALPLISETNFDPILSTPLGGCEGRIPSDGVRLWIGQESGVSPGDLRRFRAWPVEPVRAGRSGGATCYTAFWAGNERRLDAWITAGSEASATARAAVFNTFRTLQFAHGPYLGATSPRPLPPKVALFSWFDFFDHAHTELVNRSAEGIFLGDESGSGSPVSLSGEIATPDSSTGKHDGSFVGYWWGPVAPDVRWVRATFPDRTTSLFRVLRVPSTLHAPIGIFEVDRVFPAPRGARLGRTTDYQVVFEALDASGRVVGTAHDDTALLPYKR